MSTGRQTSGHSQTFRLSLLSLGKVNCAATALAFVGMLFCGVAVVLATSIPNHVVNGIRHGCPYDPGCADDQADAVRHGYSRMNDRVPMAYAYLSVRTAAADADLDFVECSNCERLDIQFDLSGLDVLECQLPTFHFVEGRDIEHNHFTTDGPC